MKRGKQIKYICTRNKHGIGDPSSEYGYDRDGKLFEATVQRHIDEGIELYAEFKEWMKSKNVTPDVFRRLFRHYYEEFIEDQGNKGDKAYERNRKFGSRRGETERLFAADIQ